ncbi:hypothetical protein FGIG_12442 [Fasciola gigantica]|uniref:Uncharacterized protein n=1 Tax=Fasciola gigantica TaxID=46835 RepID=A0A504Y3Z0_FASGI|nr:hypothetical protein FGIG_12442 [Fasciola gigantica]
MVILSLSVSCSFDESQSISESSIRLFDPRLVVTDPVDLATTGSDMSVQMPRSLDDALVDSYSKPPLYYSTPLEQCKNRDESNEFSWVDHQTQDDISLLSEDSTLSTVTPRDGEHSSKVDSSLVTPEYPLEPNQTDTAQSAVPELILESEDQVTALHSVRGRPITSKLGCADAPICWYSPALEPITENSEYSVPSTTFNTVTAATTNNHQMKLADSEAGGCIATISEELLREFNELEYAVDEVESSQAWITVQLQQFQLTLVAANGRVNDAATITNQLAQIDQLLQTLAPLGARLRNLDQRVEQVWNNLPVCESTKRYGEPSTPTKVTGDKLIEANQTSLVKSKMDTNQCGKY